MAPRSLRPGRGADDGVIGADETDLRESRAAAAFRRLLITAVALSALTLFIASLAIALLVRGTQSTTAWVNHTYQVERALSDIRVALEKTEAARRGYLISGDPVYRAIFQRTTDGLQPMIKRVQALTRDNPRQQVAVDRLRAEVDAHLAAETASLALGSQAGQEHSPAAAAIMKGQPQLQQTRDVLAGMVSEEGRLLALRTGAQTRFSTGLLIVTVAAAVVIVILASVAYLLMRRYATDLDRSRSALRRLNLGLEDEVARRTAELTRANAEIQRFAYIVSHDLRSPLVNVMGFTSEMQLALKPLRALLERVEGAPGLEDARELREARVAVDEEIPESLGFIRASTQKMDRLINAILKLSREGRRNLTPERIAMDALMGQIADTLKRQTEERGAQIEIAPDIPTLISDRVAVEQVFSNIVENALKYLKPGRPGRIVVRGRREGLALVYEVEDNGRGIAPHDHERVFDLFRRAGVQDQPGEGIGLAHVRALVHRLGGSIGVQSELDQGATFRISLPPALTHLEETVA